MPEHCGAELAFLGGSRRRRGGGRVAPAHPQVHELLLECPPGTGGLSRRRPATGGGDGSDGGAATAETVLLTASEPHWFAFLGSNLLGTCRFDTSYLVFRWQAVDNEVEPSS